VIGSLAAAKEKGPAFLTNPPVLHEEEASVEQIKRMNASAAAGRGAEENLAAAADEPADPSPAQPSLRQGVAAAAEGARVSGNSAVKVSASAT
jgi:hypothetical protein